MKYINNTSGKNVFFIFDKSEAEKKGIPFSFGLRIRGIEILEFNDDKNVEYKVKNDGKTKKFSWKKSFFKNYENKCFNALIS